MFPLLLRPLHCIGALHPHAGLGRASRQKAGVNVELTAVQFPNTFVAHTLSSSIVICSRRVSLTPTVFIMARGRNPLFTFATCCLPFAMSSLKTPQFCQSPSHSSGPHSDALSSVTFLSIPLGQSSPHTELYRILSGARLAVGVSSSGQ